MRLMGFRGLRAKRYIGSTASLQEIIDIVGCVRQV